MSINAEDLFVFNNQVGSVEALFGAETNTAAQARAEYIYSSYGEVMMKSGDLADKNNIGYSTRYREGNTGLVSYTYRHYSPRLKKWLSKDPIAEQGGINLYQMVGNDPVNYWDMLGYLEYFLNHFPITSSKYSYNGTQLDFDQLPDVEKCYIEIFVGHGADAPFSQGEGTYNKALQARNRQAKENLIPGQYASSGVGCADANVNLINSRGTKKGLNYGYDNSNRTNNTRRGFNLPQVDSIKNALDKEIEAAKNHADSKMLKKKPPKYPACCDYVTIRVIIILGDRGNALANYFDAIQNFYRKYGSQYKKPIIYP